MASMFFGNAIWQLVKQADVVSKIVLFILLFMSIICWAIFFYKLILFRIKRKQIIKVINEIGEVRNFSELVAVVKANKGTLPGYFLAKNIAFLQSVAQFDPITTKADISTRQLELFQQNLDQSVEDIVYHEQAYLTVLSTSAAAAPLLGLFGTVWGLVHAFVRISEKHSADIATVAPGIAEALITTLAGLAVAVPALIIWNYCSSQVRKIDHLVTLLADKFVIKVQQVVLD